MIQPQGEKRRRVGLLLGCVQRVFFPQVNAATARVLAAEGCEVVAPEAPTLFAAPCWFTQAKKNRRYGSPDEPSTYLKRLRSTP